MNGTPRTTTNLKNKRVIYHFTKQQNALLLLIIHKAGGSFQTEKLKQITFVMKGAKQAQSSNLQLLMALNYQ